MFKFSLCNFNKFAKNRGSWSVRISPKRVIITSMKLTSIQDFNGLIMVSAKITHQLTTIPIELAEALTLKVDINFAHEAGKYVQSKLNRLLDSSQS